MGSKVHFLRVTRERQAIMRHFEEILYLDEFSKLVLNKMDFIKYRLNSKFCMKRRSLVIYCNRHNNIWKFLKHIFFSKKIPISFYSGCTTSKGRNYFGVFGGSLKGSGSIFAPNFSTKWTPYFLTSQFAKAHNIKNY